jgi:hypothetical protein
MSLTVDDDRRGRIRSRSLSRNRAADNDFSIARDRSAAPAYAGGLGVSSSAIRSRSPFEAPPIINDDIPVRFDDAPRYQSKDGSMYDYERRPAAAYQILPGSSPRSSRDNISSPRASANALQSPLQVEAYEEAWRRDEELARKKDRLQNDLAYGRLPGLDRNPASSSPNLSRQNPTYADSPTSVKYGTVGRDPGSPSAFTAAGILKDSQRGAWYGMDPSASSPSVLTVDPSGGRRGHSRVRSEIQPPTGRMSNLSISTGHRHTGSLTGAPGSPMLESYHGTYQQVSPMPSPLLLASQAPDNFPHAMEALSLSDDERGSRRGRRARFHDPAEIAESIAVALRGNGMPDVVPLIEILPGLTHEQVMELRVEYKVLVKTGADRKGVNVAKREWW